MTITDDRYNIGVDIGGTFTDCVVKDRRGRFVLDKAFTTPGRLVDGVIQSLENACGQLGRDLDEVLASTDAFKTGTTSPINRLINRAGATVALITTRGHEDAVLIGRVQQKLDGLSAADRSDLRHFEKADPLVPRTRIYGLDERIDSTGEVISPVDDAQIESVVSECVAKGVDAFAVCLLWSFANPAHERAVRQVIERTAPEAFVVLSSDIAPVIGEYERSATTILNSYLGPGTSDDLTSLELSLKERGLRSGVFVMQSNGGVIPAGDAVAQPVYLLGSGPVGGVAATRQLSDRLPGRNAIATDMGGTSFDVGVISDGRPVEVRVSIHERYRVLVSAVEVTSIGAGGGSVAYLDPVTGVLQVGPESAGADPGPVCYGFGGKRPTVTDANAVLGRLNPALFFAGRRSLDVDAARQAITRELAEPLGVPPETAAKAVVDIVDSRMADLIRNLTVERGLDPREFTVVAYGGGGPLHVGSYARQIGCRTAVIPRAAPVYSAWGIADSPVVRSYAISSPSVLPVPTSTIRGFFEELAKKMEDGRSNGADSRDGHSMYVDMRYRYQLQELGVPLTAEDLGAEDLSDVLMGRFEAMYEDRFGRGTTFRGAATEISTFRLVSAESFAREAGTQLLEASADPRKDDLEIWFDDRFETVPVYDADSLVEGFRVSGPCMLAGRLTTAIIHDGQSVEVDEHGELTIDLAPQALVSQP